MFAKQMYHKQVFAKQTFASRATKTGGAGQIRY